MYKFAFITNDKNGNLIVHNKINEEQFNSRTGTASLLFDDLIFFNFIKMDQIDQITELSKIDENTFIFYAVTHLVTDDTFEKIFSIKAKKYLFDFASNDIIYYRNHLNIIEKYGQNKDYCYITKSLDFKNIKNAFYYDQQLTRMSNWLFNIKQPWKNFLFNSKFNSQTITSFNLLDNVKNRENLLPSYKALYLIGHARFHKMDLLNHYYSKNLLNEFLWASSSRNYDAENGYVKNIHLKDYNDFKVLDILPKKLDYGYEESELPLVAIGTSANFAFYLDSCFEIIGETEFYKTEEQNEIVKHHISEKTIKPLLMSMPFVILNFDKTVNKLENNFGFKLNTNISELRHEYDMVENDTDRMISIKNHVDNLLSFSKKQLNDMKMQYKLETRENIHILYEVFWRNSVKKIFEFINQ